MCYGKSFILWDWMHEWTGDLLLSFKVAVWIICLPRLLNLKTYYRQQVRVLLSRVTATSGLMWFKEEEASSSLGGEDSSSPLEHTVQVTIQVPPREGAGSGGDPAFPAALCTCRRKRKNKKQALKGQSALLSLTPTPALPSCPYALTQTKSLAFFPLTRLFSYFSKFSPSDQPQLTQKRFQHIRKKKILRRNGRL